MTHTPGPWIILLSPKWETRYIQQENKTGSAAIIATIPSSSRSDDEQDANMRLIAASPTMYDYIYKQARSGDIEAQAILKTLD